MGFCFYKKITFLVIFVTKVRLHFWNLRSQTNFLIPIVASFIKKIAVSKYLFSYKRPKNPRKVCVSVLQ
jgi:hypothetical protein